jgi:hypothetical protein
MIQDERTKRANRQPREQVTARNNVSRGQSTIRFSRLQAENAELRRRAADLALAIQALSDPIIGLPPPKLRHQLPAGIRTRAETQGNRLDSR